MTEFLDPNVLEQLGLLDKRIFFAGAAVIAGGFLRGFVGFGAAMVMVPLLAVIYGPRAAIAIHAVMEIPALVPLVPAAVRHYDRTTVRPILIGLLVATPIGAWFLAFIDPRIMKATISIVVLVMVALIASNWRHRGTIRPHITFAAGAISGLTQGSAGVGGPPIVAVLLSRPDPTDTLRANVLAMMAAMQVIAIATFWAYGLVTLSVVIIGAIATPLYLLAIGLGTRHYASSGNRYYRLAALLVLAIVAVATLSVALSS